MLSVALLALAYVLTVAGVALVSIPAALTVSGVLLGAVALFVDFDRKGGTL